MSKEKNEFNPKLKSYHIFILSCLLTILVILNSNHVNKIRAQNKLNQEKAYLFDKIISNRYLEEEEGEGAEEKSTNSTTETSSDKVCKRGSEELINYYKSGNLSDIKIKEGNITCDEKDEDYMKALINIVKSTVGGEKRRLRNIQENSEQGGNSSEEDGELMDNLINYGKHIIPVLIFIVVGILCIPGWIVCCFCCCCNCCCCCCCKKPKCKIPFFIISCAMYALVVAVCIYGFSQSNHIFVGLADTECSILKFVDEVLEGESKDSLPKWAGIRGIKDILIDLNGEVRAMGSSTAQQLTDAIDNIDNEDTGKKTKFLQELQSYSNDLYNNGDYNKEGSNYYKKSYTTGSYAKGTFVLDLVKNFGIYNKERNEATPTNSYAYIWVEEYSAVSELADEKMGIARDGFNDILNEKLGTVTDALDKGIEAIDGIDSSFGDIKGDVSNIIVDYSGIIDEYGKLVVKLVFGILALIDIGIAVLIFLLCFCSGKACVKCCCCQCLIKLFTHILWNVLALLMIIVFLVGSLIALIGKVGEDGTSLFSYLVSEDNLGEDKETVLLGAAKEYLTTCVNGDGKIEDKLGFDTKNLDSLNDIKDAQDNITYAKNQFESKKEMFTYKNITGELEKRKELNTDLLTLIRISNDAGDKPSEGLNLGILLRDINNYANSKNKHEVWEVTCDKDYTCKTGTDDNIPSGNICFKPKKCLPSLRDWVETLPTSENLFIEKAGIISDMNTIVENAADSNKYFKKNLIILGNKYKEFLESYIEALGKFNNTINRITNKLNTYTGKDGGVFSFINCRFIGTNMKIILKYLKESLGKDFYTVGVCLILVGCSLALSIIFTILLVIIINEDISQKKKEQEKNKGIPEYPIITEERAII